MSDPRFLLESWSFDGSRVVDARNKATVAIAQSEPWVCNRSVLDNQNARFIADAPEMYRILDAVMGWFDEAAHRGDFAKNCEYDRVRQMVLKHGCVRVRD